MGIKVGGGEGMQSPVARSTSDAVVSLSRTAPNNGRNSDEGSLRSERPASTHAHACEERRNKEERQKTLCAEPPEISHYLFIIFNFH